MEHSALLHGFHGFRPGSVQALNSFAESYGLPQLKIAEKKVSVSSSWVGSNMVRGAAQRMVNQGHSVANVAQHHGGVSGLTKIMGGVGRDMDKLLKSRGASAAEHSAGNRAMVGEFKRVSGLPAFKAPTKLSSSDDARLRAAIREALKNHPDLEKKSAVKIAIPLSAFAAPAKALASGGKAVASAVPDLSRFKSLAKPLDRSIPTAMERVKSVVAPNPSSLRNAASYAKPKITNARQAFRSDHPNVGAGSAIARAQPSAGKVVSRGVGVSA